MARRSNPLSRDSLSSSEAYGLFTNTNHGDMPWPPAFGFGRRSSYHQAEIWVGLKRMVYKSSHMLMEKSVTVPTISQLLILPLGVATSPVRITDMLLIPQRCLKTGKNTLSTSTTRATKARTLFHSIIPRLLTSYPGMIHKSRPIFSTQVCTPPS